MNVRVWGRLDWWGSALALTGLGLAMQYSLAFSGSGQSPGFFWRQLLAVGLGLILAWYVSRQDFHVWALAHWWWYALSLLLLVAVLVFGHTLHGTKGWFSLGWLQFQPVEMVKVLVVLGTARLVSGWTAGSPSWRQLLGSALYVAGPFFLIAVQPDMGSGLLLWAVWATLVWLGGVTWRQVGVLAVGALGVAVVAWFLILRPYQKERVLVFFDPGRSPLSSGYQVRQAIIAVGSGSWLGKGLGRGTQTQLNFLPDARTDFIFSALAEELGLLGVGVLLALFGFFTRASFQVAGGPVNRAAAFSIGGLTALLIIQAGLNLAMNVGWSPVIGVPLPFLSYGGSSLLGSWLIVGVLQSFVRGRPA